MRRRARPSFAIAAATALFLAAPVGQAGAADRVDVGIASSATDVLLLLAEQRGYFKEQNLDIDLVQFDSGAKMIAPLGQGQIDIGGAITSLGLYNAVGRGIRLKIVADKGHTAPGYDNQTVMIRKDLVDSGRFKSLADLRGRKIALTAQGVATMSVLNEAAKAGGIAYDDIETPYLPFPEQVAAFDNKGIDGSLMIEPFATVLVKSGTAVRFESTDVFYPHFQIGVLVFSEGFAKERRAVGIRFLEAYFRAIKDYNAALVDARLRGPGAEPILKLLSERFHLDPALARDMYSPAFNEDGKVNAASLEKDWAFFKARGLIEGNATVADMLDPSFAAAAAGEKPEGG